MKLFELKSFNPPKSLKYVTESSSYSSHLWASFPLCNSVIELEFEVSQSLDQDTRAVQVDSNLLSRLDCHQQEWMLFPALTNKVYCLLVLTNKY